MLLQLTSPESKLRVRDGLFEVSWFDAENQLQKVQHPPAHIRSIWLNEGATVTVAAMRLAMSNQIDMVVCDRFGDPEGRMLAIRPTTTTLVQKAQALAGIGAEGLRMARDWAARKLSAQAGMIEKLARRRNRDKDPGLSSAVSVIHQMRRQMLDISLESAEKQQFAELSASIRGFEGIASKAFFQAIADMIPPQYRFEGRSRRPATDPFNAFLNYALAVLYRKTERALVAAGLNPYLGFMHRDGYQHKSLVYDFIELFRTDLTRVVFSIFSKQSLRADTHFLDGQQNGVILTKAGKALLLAKLDKFFAKKTEWEGLNMSNDRILEKEALRAAQTLLDLMKNAADPSERSKLVLEEALEFTDITLN